MDRNLKVASEFIRSVGLVADLLFEYQITSLSSLVLKMCIYVKMIVMTIEMNAIEPMYLIFPSIL